MEAKFNLKGVDKDLQVYENKVVLTNKKVRGIEVLVFGCYSSSRY